MKIRVVLVTAAVALSTFALCAQSRQKDIRVVATNSWTAAFAVAAGAKDVVTLAPSDLRHPAEYELKPSDVARLKGAKLIVTTGFEVMAKRLAEAAGSRRIRVLRVDADYSLPTLRTSILAIADVLGTQDQARVAIADLETFLASWKQELRDDGLYGAPIVVHVFQQPLMTELGFTIKGVFGPAPLEAAQIAKLSAEKVTYIVDNWHNEVAAPLRETMPDARYASLINFPGPDDTETLIDVLSDDRHILSTAK
ncbi:MAG TPA: zinc ABC transporter substrate-binding protein [Spirochaetia bacterium]|nr:zinc ABC transporter substrate-binding protein [Spirochaetia bacterium]